VKPPSSTINHESGQALLLPATVPSGASRLFFRADDLTICMDIIVPFLNTAADKDDGVSAKSLSEQAAANETVNETADSMTTMLHTLSNAVALADHEQLLCCLAAWFDKDFSWQPVNDPEIQQFDLTLSSTAHQQRKIGVSLGDNARNALANFPDSWRADVTAVSHRQPVYVCLAELCLSNADYDRLLPGSCLLLPTTYGLRCPVTLFDQDRRSKVTFGELDSQSGRLSAGQQPQQQTRQSQCTVRVFADSEQTIDLTQWESAGDNAQSAKRRANVCMPLLDGMRMTVEIGVTDQSANTPSSMRSLSGELVPVAAGFAVMLDR